MSTNSYLYPTQQQSGKNSPLGFSSTRTTELWTSRVPLVRIRISHAAAPSPLPASSTDARFEPRGSRPTAVVAAAVIIAVILAGGRGRVQALQYVQRTLGQRLIARSYLAEARAQRVLACILERAIKLRD